MECIKGMIAGIMLGMVAGAFVGACNSSALCDCIKEGKREIKRFKRKYM